MATPVHPNCRGQLVHARFAELAEQHGLNVMQPTRTPRPWRDALFGLLAACVGAAAVVSVIMHWDELRTPSWYTIGALVGVALFAVGGGYVWMTDRTVPGPATESYHFTGQALDMSADLTQWVNSGGGPLLRLSAAGHARLGDPVTARRMMLVASFNVMGREVAAIWPDTRAGRWVERTPGGRLLTDQDFDKLADEAERALPARIPEEHRRAVAGRTVKRIAERGR